jgi:hypothetical protein
MLARYARRKPIYGSNNTLSASCCAVHTEAATPLECANNINMIFIFLCDYYSLIHALKQEKIALKLDLASGENITR